MRQSLPAGRDTEERAEAPAGRVQDVVEDMAQGVAEDTGLVPALGTLQSKRSALHNYTSVCTITKQQACSKIIFLASAIRNPNLTHNAGRQ